MNYLFSIFKFLFGILVPKVRFRYACINPADRPRAGPFLDTPNRCIHSCESISPDSVCRRPPPSSPLGAWCVLLERVGTDYATFDDERRRLEATLGRLYDEFARLGESLHQAGEIRFAAERNLLLTVIEAIQLSSLRLSAAKSIAPSRRSGTPSSLRLLPLRRSNSRSPISKDSSSSSPLRRTSPR